MFPFKRHNFIKTKLTCFIILILKSSVTKRHKGYLQVKKSTCFRGSKILAVK